jgi:hypothetical protein
MNSASSAVDRRARTSSRRLLARDGRAPAQPLAQLAALPVELVELRVERPQRARARVGGPARALVRVVQEAANVLVPVERGQPRRGVRPEQLEAGEVERRPRPPQERARPRRRGGRAERREVSGRRRFGWIVSRRSDGRQDARDSGVA